MLFSMPSLDGLSNPGGRSFNLNTAAAESLLRRAIAHARPPGSQDKQAEHGVD
jgi:hypothetical protein